MNKNIIRLQQFFNNPFFHKQRFWIILIALLATLIGINENYLAFKRGEEISNNYKIFEYVFYHVWNQEKLYILYPELYRDVNHYGPIFSIFIAPFALLPSYLGSVLWNIFSHISLVYAVWQLDLTNKQKSIAILVTLNLFIISMMHSQSNPIIAALLILSYVFIKKEKDVWAVLLILLGAFIKIYGVVGLGLFFFSKHKRKFILSCVLWSIILAVLPMIISSSSYILNTYAEWYEDLKSKNQLNLLARIQSISVIGMFYKITRNTSISSLVITLPAVLLMGSTYLKFKRFSHPLFQINTLALLLLSICLFSSGTENPTNIIAVIGVSIWYVSLPKKNLLEKILLTGVIVFTVFSPSDLFYRPLYQGFLLPYSLHCLPLFFVWLYIIYQQWFSKEMKLSLN